MIQALYMCGTCEHWHRSGYGGDCRDDSERFTDEQRDSLFGVEGEGWREDEPVADLTAHPLPFGGLALVELPGPLSEKQRKRAVILQENGYRINRAGVLLKDTEQPRMTQYEGQWMLDDPHDDEEGFAIRRPVLGPLIDLSWGYLNAFKDLGDD